MKKSAFSLVELAVIILIISIIAVGVTKGISMVQSSRIASARATTKASKINEIDGILAWYETTMQESLEKDERIDGASMSTWNDIATAKALADGENILTRTANSNVSYKASGINKLPSLQFVLSGNFTLSAFYQGVYSDYTVFAVLSPTLSLSGGTEMTFLDAISSAGTNSLTISDTALDIDSSTSSSLSTSFAANNNYIVGAYISAHQTNVFNNSIDNTASSGVTVNGFNGLTVGTNKASGSGFTGLISEIIIFNRILSYKERMSVMNYLSKKYAIRLQ